MKNRQKYFHFESIALKSVRPDKTNYEQFETFEEAYHRLMFELVELQVISCRLAIGNTEIKNVYVDGGFADNEIYIKVLSYHFPSYVVYSTQSPLGSAVGAALIIADTKSDNSFLNEYCKFKKYSY